MSEKIENNEGLKTREPEQSNELQAKDLQAEEAQKPEADAGSENLKDITVTAEEVVSSLVGSPNFPDVENMEELVQNAFDSTTVDETYWNGMSQERRDKVIQRQLDKQA